MLSSWTSFLGLIKCNSMSIFKFTQTTAWSDRKIICAATSATGSFNSDGDFNPFEVLGVSPIEKFDLVKAANRKKGVTFGSFKAYTFILNIKYIKIKLSTILVNDMMCA
ncbi:hypothetical protein ACSQ67_020598 [Phaseolus vulgaris]